jgi:hypothetical protein
MRAPYILRQIYAELKTRDDREIGFSGDGLTAGN